MVTHFRRGHVPAKSMCIFGQTFSKVLLPAQQCDITFGGDMSPPKVCVENLYHGQLLLVPAQRHFCRVATFGGDMCVPAKKLVARRPIWCSE